MQSNEERKISQKNASELDKNNDCQKSLFLEHAGLKEGSVKKSTLIKIGAINSNSLESKGKTRIGTYKPSIQNMYDTESADYVACRPWMESYLFQRITQSVSDWLKKFSKNCVILNVGCGPGWLEKHICGKLHASEFVAIDISKKMARMTKNRVPNIDVIVADGESLPFKPNSVEAILSSRAIKYLDVNKFLNQAKQTLTDEGAIGILYDCGDTLWLQFLERIGRKMDPGIHARTMRTSELRSALSQQEIEVQDFVQLSWLPQRIFTQFPRAFYGFLSFIDRPWKRSRIALITGKKKMKASIEKKQEPLEFAIVLDEEIKVTA